MLTWEKMIEKWNHPELATANSVKQVIYQNHIEHFCESLGIYLYIFVWCRSSTCYRPNSDVVGMNLSYTNIRIDKFGRIKCQKILKILTYSFIIYFIDQKKLNEYILLLNIEMSLMHWTYMHAEYLADNNLLINQLIQLTWILCGWCFKRALYKGKEEENQQNVFYKL